VIPCLTVRRMKEEEKGGGFLRPVAFCGRNHFPIPHKKNRDAKQSGF
jgi:hypothetical protein